jgi:hypothetical protein
MPGASTVIAEACDARHAQAEMLHSACALSFEFRLLPHKEWKVDTVEWLVCMDPLSR